MRHNLSGRQLSRIAPHRHAMLRNMAASLLRHETIRTTVPKAKELRRVVEPLITLGKVDSEAARRRAFAQLRDTEVVVKLFEDLGPHYQSRPGGYTRILHMMPRPGDSAEMALMQLVDRPDPNAEVEDAAEAKSAKKGQGKDKADKAADEAPKRKKAAKADADEDEEVEETKKKTSAKKKAPAKSAKSAAKKKSRK